MVKILILMLLFLPSVLAVNLEVNYDSEQIINVNEFFTSSFEIRNLEDMNEFVITREIGSNEELKSALGATIKYFEMEHYSIPYLEYTINLAKGNSETFNIESRFRKLSLNGIVRLPEFHVFDNQGKLLYNFRGEEIQLNCKKDNYCDLKLGENSLNCPQDCNTGGADNYCDMILDYVCDPNCLTELDLDCEEGEGITEIPMPKKLSVGETPMFNSEDAKKIKQINDARLKAEMNKIFTGGKTGKSLIGRGYGELPEGRGGLIVFAVLVLVLIGYFIRRRKKR